MATAKPLKWTQVAMASPLYAHKAPKPSAGEMMQGGGMSEMMGMMSMMEQMAGVMKMLLDANKALIDTVKSGMEHSK